MKDVDENTPSLTVLGVLTIFYIVILAYVVIETGSSIIRFLAVTGLITMLIVLYMIVYKTRVEGK